jgi:aspartate aminotransferase-like enzyme
MEQYRIPLVPGPVAVPEEILQARALPYASPDLEDEFFALYSSCEFGLQQLLSTRNDVAILSGEGMLALWGALKSTILPGDRVLSVSNGVFGHGIAEMARQCGATVELVAFPYDQEIDVELVREAAVEFQPQIITAVHCETPSGVLNPLDELGALAAELDALFIVDVVASAAGVPVLVDDWHIDLGLLGSQKCLSLPPDLSMVSISEKGWERIRRADYNGYDALLPFRSAQAERLFPYTHNWHALAGLQVALQMLEAEGIEEVYRRHVDAMETCQTRLSGMDIRLYPASPLLCSPTVTAAYLPSGWPWPRLRAALHHEGMGVGGSYGQLDGVVFRIGHMGAQASHEVVHRGMDVLEYVLGHA